jgi:hypothetical protein
MVMRFVSSATIKNLELAGRITGVGIGASAIGERYGPPGVGPYRRM